MTLFHRLLCTGFLACLTGLSPRLHADQEAPPVPWVMTTEKGCDRFFFKMVPPRWRLIVDQSEAAKRKRAEDPFAGHYSLITEDTFSRGPGWVKESAPYGVAYEITATGDFKELWRVDGWYTFKGYLSEDGRYFVRMGLWASDLQHHTDLAIAFYDRGTLLKEYAVKDLIRHPELLENSTSHYDWQPETQSMLNGFVGEGGFHLVMIDKTVYTFDYRTGQILKTGLDASARSMRERVREEADATRKKTKKPASLFPFLSR